MTADHLPAAPVEIRRALLSVSDKTGVIDLARALAAHGVELLSTGGTAKALRDAGLAVKDVGEATGFPEMMDGRVKTLHPVVHGGLLGRAGTDDAVMAQHGIAPIDLLVLNLYPFEKVSANPGSTLDEIVENIDIGGPAMLRSAAKNFARVAVATDPAQYAGIIRELDANGGALSAKTRFALAVAAFNRVAQYDARISDVLSAIDEPSDEGAKNRSAFGAQANVTATIDGKAFPMVTEGEAAWLAVEADEATFVEAMKAGSKLVVSGTSAKGNKMTDNYDLSGVTAALGEIAKACA